MSGWDRRRFPEEEPIEENFTIWARLFITVLFVLYFFLMLPLFVIVEVLNIVSGGRVKSWAENRKERRDD